jgi:hypothetical protein
MDHLAGTAKLSQHFDIATAAKPPPKKERSTLVGLTH